MDNDFFKNSNEVGLIELFQRVWMNRVLVIYSLLVFLIVGIAYLLLSVNVYESKTTFTMVSAAQVESYNIGRSEAGFKKFTAEEIYGVFLQILRSERLRNVFIEKEYLPALGDKASGWSKSRVKESFAEVLSIKQSDPRRDSNLYEISVRYYDPEVSKVWVDRYLRLATDFTKAEIRSRIEAERKVRGESLEFHANTLRARGKAERFLLIEQVEEALEIAKAANLEVPVENSTGSPGRSSDFSQLYLRGGKALRKQLSLLKTRKSDDPYIEGLREVNMQLTLLHGMKLNDSDLQLVTVEEESEVPDKPVQPKKALVLVLSLVLGLVVGVFLSASSKYSLPQKG